MIEARESLSAYCTRVFDRKPAHTRPEVRLALIDIIHERAATNLAGSKVLSFQNDVDKRRECSQWQEEFRRLVPLIHHSLDADFLQAVVGTLARLSRTLLLEESARSHEPFVQALLEREIDRF